MSYIYILPIETSDMFHVETLERSIQNTFGLQTISTTIKINLKRTYNPSRQQYNSSEILKQIISKNLKDAVKILGVVEVDLFVPILTFVFGEAQLEGVGAVVSSHRLNNIFYGLPENRELLSQRLGKEAIHELGHTFGLLHCSHPACVMNSSTYVEDIDQKSQEMCMYCKQNLIIK